jgi:hypothetical protein
VGFITKILDDIADEDGGAHLGALGANITKLRPEFDPRTHGYKKLSDLIKGYPLAFELQARNASGGTVVMYARRNQVDNKVWLVCFRANFGQLASVCVICTDLTTQLHSA